MSQPEKAPKSVTTLFLRDFIHIWPILRPKSVMKWCFYETLIRSTALLWKANPISSAFADPLWIGPELPDLVVPFLSKAITVTKSGAEMRSILTKHLPFSPHGCGVGSAGWTTQSSTDRDCKQLSADPEIAAGAQKVKLLVKFGRWSGRSKPIWRHSPLA